MFHRPVAIAVTAVALIAAGCGAAGAAGTAETVAIWQKAGKDVQLVTLEGESHEFEARWHEAMDGVLAFFDDHLR